jgi:hypothetical protein
MELWMLLGLAIAAAAVAVAGRLGKTRRSSSETETKNIYPLW